jgi:hypothetical protein
MPEYELEHWVRQYPRLVAQWQLRLIQAIDIALLGLGDNREERDRLIRELTEQAYPNGSAAGPPRQRLNPTHQKIIELNRARALGQNIDIDEATGDWKPLVGVRPILMSMIQRDDAGSNDEE